jgi:hypothetical protein
MKALAYYHRLENEKIDFADEVGDFTAAIE